MQLLRETVTDKGQTDDERLLRYVIVILAITGAVGVFAAGMLTMILIFLATG